MTCKPDLICVDVKPHAFCDCPKCREFVAQLERGSRPYVSKEDRAAALSARVIRAVARECREKGEAEFADAYDALLGLLERRMVGA